MRRFVLTVTVVTSVAVLVGAAVWAYEADCQSCGGDNPKSYCCTCQECAGHYEECQCCDYLSGWTKCKWHDTGTSWGCCTYLRKPRKYKTTGEGEGGCPCGTSTVGQCGSTYYDSIESVTWHSNMACWNGGTPGNADVEYESPPYSCVGQKPNEGGGG
ncbi:MAG: hypothetical protein GX446_01415 [Chthonomonadales bacterium]|nr:hypothetical protein [Chthonomonadales bacterium]